MLSASVTSAPGNEKHSLKNRRLTSAIEPGEPIDGGVGAEIQVMDVTQARDGNSF